MKLQFTDKKSKLMIFGNKSKNISAVLGVKIEGKEIEKLLHLIILDILWYNLCSLDDKMIIE